jgi:hypothetical protein
MTFKDKNTFACGLNFVIGQGKPTDPQQRSPQKKVSPMKRVPTSSKPMSDLSEIQSQGLHEEQSSSP